MMFLRTTSFILLIIFLAFTSSSQQKITNYSARWKSVDSLITNKGLTKSALSEVDNIYAIAKKEKQEAQLIKALIYKIDLLNTTEENSATQTRTLLENELKSSVEPAKSILYALLSRWYQTYYQQNLYKLYDRTGTVNVNKKDVDTWSAKDIQSKITELLLASIKEEIILKHTNLNQFDPIIVKGNVRYLRPTLYDLLAQNAVEYFQTGYRELTNPSYSFQIKDEVYFAPAAEFVKLHVATADSASLSYQTLLLYQKLLTFHLNDAKPDALIDADLQRLQFVQQHATLEDKDKQYEQALSSIIRKYENIPASEQASYLIAQLHANKASLYIPLKYDEKDPVSPQGEYVIAANICKKIIERNDSSEGAINCYNLLKEIERKEINLTTEKVNIPNESFRTLVSYRNFTDLYFRVIKINNETSNVYDNRYGNDYWQLLTRLSSLHSWHQALPATNDYQKHRTEIKVDALPVGEYILLASTKEDFSLDKNALAVQFFYVSGISYVNNRDEYFVLDRTNGKPLVNASIQFWVNQYDNTKRQNVLQPLQKYTTDKNGYFKSGISRSNQYASTKLEVTYDKDRLFLNDFQYIPYKNEGDNSSPNQIQFEKDNARVFFFTDRSIYRPGQTIYFKGIAVTKDFQTKNSKPYPAIASVVFLYNANGEKVDSLQLTTNAFGSYSGKFKLPQGLLNGEFYLHSDVMDGDTYFSVEEYKRPTFLASYEKIKGTYEINDSITIFGNVKGYAGNNINAAQVKYRVQRIARFIYPWLYSKWGSPTGSNMEIANGTTITNADGKFAINFKAIPDETIHKDVDPIFDYKVTADITDIGGETRSAETTVSVSYKALQLKVIVPPILPSDSLKTITAFSQNMNGSFEPALVSVVMYDLQIPERMIRKRYWPQPDQYVMTKEEFIKNFPFDEFLNESDYRTWQKNKIYLRKIDSTKSTGIFTLPKSQLPQGWYAIEISTKDKNGEEVKDIEFIQLYDEKSTAVPGPAYAWQSMASTVTEPGGISSISIGSSANDLFIIQQIDKNKDDNNANQHSSYNFIQLNNEKRKFEFPVKESDRGGFGINHLFVKNNRFYKLTNTIDVPWTNKELDISYETFRDNTLPGSKEKYKLKISGYKNEKIAGEMLASMYDASLDQFKSHSWSVPSIWENFNSNSNWQYAYCFYQVQSEQKYQEDISKTFAKSYDVLIKKDYVQTRRFRMGVPGAIKDISMQANDIALLSTAKPVSTVQADMFVAAEKMNKDVQPNEAQKPPVAESITPVQIRKNFNETAFFYPDLKTDSSGNIEFEFTIPEALTKWKLQTLAHTKDLAFGYSTNTVVTQKPLMVQPNLPRFLREGDKLELSARVINLTDKEQTGTVQLELSNTATNESVSGWFRNMYPTQYFTAEANQSTVVKFTIDVPYQFNSAVTYRFVASSGNNSDGEEAAIPVLTNSTLVTESMPLPMRGNTAKNFQFTKLLQSGNSETLQHHRLTVEFTTNPAWYAVQALPYLMEYPYECAEQTFNRYYANAIATGIVKASPRLKEVFEKWKTTDTSALLSNLQKNMELKSVLLEETPWVMESKNETQQKKNIALLFDMMRMNQELSATFDKLKQLQSENGGFVWFKGGADDRYITQYILTGLGHLKKLQSLNAVQQKDWSNTVTNAIKYLDQRIKEDYDELIKHKTDLKKNNLSYTAIQYLYMRSFFSEYGIPGASFTAINYYRKQSQQFWLQQNRYMQGMIALSLFRSGDIKTAEDILKSLKQNAIINDELGMYWKENTGGYYWQQAPVETQSLLIEAFSEIGKDVQAIDNLKTWLLKQKQTSNWKTTKATSEACYALLLQGSDWLSNTPTVDIKLGNKSISSTNEKQEAGTGYFKQTIEGQFVNPSMGEITVKIASPAAPVINQPAWGAVYWQYFEHLDKITPASTPLKLNKQLFVEKNTDRGPVLEPVLENAYLKVGDKIKVRIVLKVDRDMEYIHMKDMRASCMEPVNVLSGYKWQGGLGYYESTKDASTNFFFGWLPKGTYVFEYPLFVTHTGNFSNGISSIQSMYAPEFASHSEGVRVNVEENK